MPIISMIFVELRDRSGVFHDKISTKQLTLYGQRDRMASAAGV